MRLKAILCLGLLTAGLTCVSCSAKNEAPKEQMTTENEVEEFLEKARDRNDTNVSKEPDTEEKSGEDKEEESIFKPQEELPEQEAEEEIINGFLK